MQFEAVLMFTHKKKKSTSKTVFVSSEVFLMIITFSIISFAGLAHTTSFFRVSTSTHSQAVCSATYMQFSAVITSVRLFPKEKTHDFATRLNKDASFSSFFSPSPLHILSGDDCFLLCCSLFFKAFSPALHKRKK